MSKLLAFVLAMMFGACACQQVQRLSTRNTLDSYVAAVEITRMCDGAPAGRGSGVIIDATHVLTAYHVVDCMPLVLVARAGDDEPILMLVEAFDEEADVARLVIADDTTFADVAPPVIGPTPKTGETICIAAAIPARKHRCGEVMMPDEIPGDIVHEITTEPGNSGSGVYDSSGRLVGIVTHLLMASNSQIIGGRATSLWERQWLVK